MTMTVFKYNTLGYDFSMIITHLAITFKKNTWLWLVSKSITDILRYDFRK